MERFLQWADDERRELREDDAVDAALAEFLNHPFSSGAVGTAKSFLQPCSSFGRSSAIAEGGRSLADGGVSKDGDVSLQGKAAKPHTFMTWQGMAADLGVQEYPQKISYLVISVSGYLRPSEGLRFSRIIVLPLVAGRQRLLKPLASPGIGFAEVNNCNPRQFDLAGQSFTS